MQVWIFFYNLFFRLIIYLSTCIYRFFFRFIFFRVIFFGPLFSLLSFFAHRLNFVFSFRYTFKLCLRLIFRFIYLYVIYLHLRFFCFRVNNILFFRRICDNTFIDILFRFFVNFRTTDNTNFIFLIYGCSTVFAKLHYYISSYVT